MKGSLKMKKFINKKNNKKIIGMLLGLVAIVITTFISSIYSDNTLVYHNTSTPETSITSSMTTVTTTMETVTPAITTTTEILTSVESTSIFIDTTTSATELTDTTTVVETTVSYESEGSHEKNTNYSYKNPLAYPICNDLEDDYKYNNNNTGDDNEEYETSEYIVYKPSTKYVHRFNCSWVDESCYHIETTEDIEARKCTECNPDIDIINEYQDYVSEPITGEYSTGKASLDYITESERIMLCNLIGGEYGSDWVSLYDKACVVAVVMNRYYDGGWQGDGRDNTIYNVITAPSQFLGYYDNSSYNSNVTDSCIDAVEYYFENQSMFPHYTSFYGDGTRNYFS